MAAHFRDTFSDINNRNSETLATTLLPRTGTSPIKSTVPCECVPRPKTLTVATSFSRAEVAVVTKVTAIAPTSVPTSERRALAANSDEHSPAENLA